MSWTISHLKKLKNDKKIRDFKMPETKPISAKKEAKQVAWIREQLAGISVNTGYKVEEEYRFHPERKWRFDFALPELKLAVEYEGIQSEKSRHTTLKGYTGDSEKYNEAQRLGWIVLRYTVLNYIQVSENVLNIIKGVRND